MKRGLVYLGAVALMFLIGGCASIGFSDAQGWRSSQQKDFEAVLAEDRYSSLCNLKPLYQEYLQTKDTKILSKLLVGYTQNLANSCIDIKAFKAVERAKQKNKIHTSYTFYTQDASAAKILSQLQRGVPIDAILAQYIPKNPQFKRLLAKLKQGGLSPANRKKVKMSLERSKVMSDDGWSTYFLVNVPEFMVYFVENNQTKFNFPVVVGKKSWQTPIFDATMKYVVLNPTWNVPDNIARSEEIPKLLKNKDRLKKKNMIVLKSYDTSKKPVDPNSIDWKKYLSPEYQKKALPYKIIQLPSKYNALGRVKFMFPNTHSVYMHDTNAKYLFKRSFRAYSHGCIRLSKPMMMLDYLAQNGYLATNKETVDKYLASKKQKYINLSQQIPVHIGYFTAYVRDDGSIVYSSDVYGFDSSMKFKKGF